MICQLNEVVENIKGRKFRPLCAVGQNGQVLDETLQCRRNTKAAKRVPIRLVKTHYCAFGRFVTV